MKRVRIGVAGLGRIGWQCHCPVLAKHRKFDLVALADNSQERIKEGEDVFKCSGYSDFSSMLDHEGLDAVVIATPTHLHKEMSLAALKRGFHVLLEKPMAPSLAESRSIAGAAKRANRVLTVYQPRRSDASFQHLLKIANSGILGEICHVRHGMFRYVRRNDWQGLKKYGGGMLNNYGAHALDRLLLITGYDVKRVFGQLKRVATLGDAEDVVKLVYETKEGALGDMDINMASTHAPYELEVYGTLGVAILSGDRITTKTFSPKRLKKKDNQVGLAATDRAYPSDDIPIKERTVQVNRRLELDLWGNFADAIREGKELIVPPKQTLALMKVLQECRHSAGRMVDKRSF